LNLVASTFPLPSSASEISRRRVVRFGAGLSLAALGCAPVGSISPYGEGRRAAVSLTYDDGLTSQLDNAVPQLDARGMKGTFFLTAANMDRQWDRWRSAAANGHEMANHTVSHPCDLRRQTPETFAATELAPMNALIRDRLGVEPTGAYAYPCDNTELGSGPRADREFRYGDLVRRTFRMARTTDGPPNLPTAVMANRFYLNAFEPTEHTDSAGLALAYLDLAIRRGGWAILVFHGVLANWRSTGDASARVHGQILDGIQARPVWCAPVGAVLKHLTTL
jgi:peptidoglycan/xylan/chitin deacetylase (PgdA/CDA1 family)